MSVRTQRNSLPLLCLNFKKTLLVTDWYEYFLDDFDDAIIRPEWITHGIGTDRTIVEASDIITIAVTNNVDARWFCGDNVGPKMYMPLEVIGPCRITTKLISMPPDPGDTSPNQTYAGIFIGTDPTGTDLVSPPFTAHRWGRYHSPGGDDMRVRDNCGSEAAMLDCGSGCLPKWLRIEIDSSQVITFWFSNDGSAWTQYESPAATPYSIAGYDIANSFVGIFAQNQDGNANLSATFEYFLIEVYEAQNPIEEECLAPIDTRAPTSFYDGRIKQMSSLKRAVDDKTGLFQIADMSMTLANEDKHYSQKMASQFLKNQEATLYHTWTGEDPHVLTEIIKLIVEDHRMKGTDFIVKFKDITQKYFTKKVPENACTSNEFPNIHPDDEGRFMPEILGNVTLPDTYERPGAVKAVYVNILGAGTRDYLAARGWLRSAIDNANFQVYEEGQVGAVAATMTAHTDGHSYINYAPVDADATVSFNCYGYSIPIWDSGNNCIQNMAYIIQYFLRFLMDLPHSLVNSPSFATLASYYEDMGVEENCYLVLQSRVDAMETLRQLLFTGGAKGFMAMDGKFNVQRKNICNWEIASTDYHIFEQIELFGSPDRQWNLTSAINTVNVEYGLIPWQNLYTGAKSEYKENRYGADMEDDIHVDREILEV